MPGEIDWKQNYKLMSDGFMAKESSRDDYVGR